MSINVGIVLVVGAVDSTNDDVGIRLLEGGLEGTKVDDGIAVGS